MKKLFSKRHLINGSIVILSMFIFISYQNCGRANFSKTDVSSKGQFILADAKVINFNWHAGMLMCAGLCTTQKDLTIDMTTGTVNLKFTQVRDRSGLPDTSLSSLPPEGTWIFDSSAMNSLKNILADTDFVPTSIDGPVAADGANAAHNFFFTSDPSETPLRLYEESWLMGFTPGVYNTYRSNNKFLYCWVYSKLTTTDPVSGSIFLTDIQDGISSVFRRNFTNPSSSDYLDCSDITFPEDPQAGTPPYHWVDNHCAGQCVQPGQGVPPTFLCQDSRNITVADSYCSGQIQVPNNNLCPTVCDPDPGVAE